MNIIHFKIEVQSSTFRLLPRCQSRRGWQNCQECCCQGRRSDSRPRKTR